MYLIIFIEIDIVFEDHTLRNTTTSAMVRNLESLPRANRVGEN